MLVTDLSSKFSDLGPDVQKETFGKHVRDVMGDKVFQTKVTNRV